jgi:hypothetical protein
MFTHVPDASAPTRLSALSDVPAIKSAAEFSAAFFICGESPQTIRNEAGQKR